MIASARAARHEGVAEIDERAQDDVREEYRLLEPDRMPNVDAFFEETIIAQFCATANRNAVE